MNNEPLAGIRILDFSWIIAGPTAARHLALMGAQVIKIGSSRRLDPSTGGPPFQIYNQSKEHCALNIATPEGVEIAKELIAVSDVLIENFAAGVIDKMGLGYEVVKSIKPDIIMLSSAGTGHSGPDRDFVAYGSLLQHYTGWNSISGEPESGPLKGGIWADPWVGMELSMITLAALNRRIKTGQGGYIDYSMAESLTSAIGPSLVGFQMSGSPPVPNGNQDSFIFPHGIFPCKGEEDWIAISIETIDQWIALCRVIGRRDWETNENLFDTKVREQFSDEINDAISNWTRGVSDFQAMETLQNNGISAAPSLSLEQVESDDHLHASGYLHDQEFSDGNIRAMPTLPWTINGRRTDNLYPAKSIGESDEYVYENILGVSEDEFSQFKKRNIIY